MVVIADVELSYKHIHSIRITMAAKIQLNLSHIGLMFFTSLLFILTLYLELKAFTVLCQDGNV